MEKCGEMAAEAWDAPYLRRRHRSSRVHSRPPTHHYHSPTLPHVHTCTPGCVSCMNSNSLFTTVLRNFQWALRNLGYCPTTYLQGEGGGGGGGQ